MQPMNQRRPPGQRCGDHSGHEARIKNTEKILAEYHQNHVDLWTAIKGKVDMQLFLLLVALTLGNLSFQFAIYNTVKEVEKNVAVVKAEVRADIVDRADRRAVKDGR